MLSKTSFHPSVIAWFDEQFGAPTRPQAEAWPLIEELDVKDVTWLSPAGDEMSAVQWQDSAARCLAMLLDGRAQESGIKRRGGDTTILLLYNAHFDVSNFVLPAVPEGKSWERLIDTNSPDGGPASLSFGQVFAMQGRSFAAF